VIGHSNSITSRSSLATLVEAMHASALVLEAEWSVEEESLSSAASSLDNMACRPVRGVKGACVSVCERV